MSEPTVASIKKAMQTTSHYRLPLDIFCETLLKEVEQQRDAVVQECINAITAEGVRVSETANDSWRQGMFYAADVLRKLKS